MKPHISIGIVGDFDPDMYTHNALNDSIKHAADFVEGEITSTWVSTQEINWKTYTRLDYHAFWVAPGSPYKNDEAVYQLLRWCRENRFPVLGTCGGFQYMVVEYARNVLQLPAVGHEETDPQAQTLVIRKLSCSLKSEEEEVHVPDPSSWVHRMMGCDKFIGRFNCSYGVNSAYERTLNKHPFVFTAFSPDGQPRAVELMSHPFYHGTLFQPSLDSDLGKPNPLIVNFLQSCVYR